MEMRKNRNEETYDLVAFYDVFYPVNTVTVATQTDMTVMVL